MAWQSVRTAEGKFKQGWWCVSAVPEQCDAGMGLPSFKLENALKPNLDFSLPKQSIGQVPGLEKIDLSRLGLDFSRNQGRGRSYRPVFMAGQLGAIGKSIAYAFWGGMAPDNTFYAVDFPDETGRVRVQCFDGSTGGISKVRCGSLMLLRPPRLLIHQLE